MKMSEDQSKAKALYAQGGVCFAAVRGECAVTSDESGIRFLLGRAQRRELLTGYSVADKIIGRAAAFLLIDLQVASVYAKTLSRPAQTLFEQYHVPCEYGTLTERIINHRGDGPCPMEEAVRTISVPEQAIPALTEKSRQLRANAAANLQPHS